MPLEVIGAGFGRTGTNSMKLALEQLGFSKCHHMKEVISSRRQAGFWLRAAKGEKMNWDEVFEGFKASVDWPSAAYYKELADTYPDAKIILTVRDPEAWYRSTAETIYPASHALPRWFRFIYAPPVLMMESNRQLIWGGIFGGRFEDKAHAIDVFKRHIEEVKAAIPPERLLVHEAKEGWEPLCRFLGKPIPETPYPRVNEANEIKRMIKIFQWIGRAPYILAVLIALIVLILALT